VVPLTVAAAAAQAAVTVAARFAVACTDPVVLADGANVVVWLTPAPVVAKVAASTMSVRPDPAAWLRRELELAQYLLAAQLPVVPPSPEVPARVHEGAGHIMSFWAYQERTSAGPADEAEVGSMLSDLHAALRGYQRQLPVLAPFGDIPAFLSRSQTQLSPADRAMLAEAFTELTAELAATEWTGQALHGDAGVGNVMPTTRGPRWHDFEDTCYGPRAWDVAASTANPRRDSARFLAAYGEPVDADQVRICERLRRLHLTVWYCLYAERLPECRQRAAELLAPWRTGR
jgi:Ser/Thr protein kinase RdoA (MazF antagonist)